MGGGPPSGTVTLLFTDIEGSTRLWEAHPDAMRDALSRHDVVVRDAIEEAGGYVFKTVGDAFCVAFSAATDAVRAAVSVQQALAAEVWPEPVSIRVRMALHTGECSERDGDYFGTTVNRAARLEALAHGGQIVVSGATAGVLSGALPEGVVLRDLGEHRLKDLATPEQVFQVEAEGLDEEFAALRSLDNPALPNNLPRFATDLIGRERELGELGRLVATNRLVTLTGAGGAGKTRLALQVAADSLDGSGDGVWLVELAPVGEPDRVAAAVAAVLGVREDPARPMGDVLVEALTTSRVLVLLDNCEHVIDAVAKLADALIRSCSGVELIATSREPLGVDGERVFRVPSLDIPAQDASLVEVTAASGVELFVARARHQQTSFVVDADNASVVAAIVRRLDGIPLALELAAARLRSMSVAEVGERLDQRFRLLTTGSRTAVARQQTLRATIDWSYSLLDDAERAVLRRASVFIGGFDLDAAEAVLADGNIVDRFDMIDVVDRLVEKSLFQHEPMPIATSRYRLLESIHDYAAEQLIADAGEIDALRRAHLAHYVTVAAASAAHLTGPEQDEWYGRLALDHDNFLAALRTAVEMDDCAGLGRRLVRTLDLYLVWEGFDPQMLGPLLDLCQRDGPDDERAATLRVLARVQLLLGESGPALETADTALSLARGTGDDHLVAEVLNVHAWIAAIRGDYTAALAETDEVQAVADRSGDTTLQDYLLGTRALALFGLGRVDDARSDCRSAIDRSRAAGNHRDEANGLVVLGSYDLAAGDLEAAEIHLAAAQLLIAHHGLRYVANIHALVLGHVAARRGDTAAARAHFESAVTLSARVNERSILAHGLIGCAWSIAGTDPTRAAVLLHSGEKLLASTGERAWSAEPRIIAETLASLTTALTPAELEAAAAHAARQSIPDLVALVTHTAEPV